MPKPDSFNIIPKTKKIIPQWVHFSIWASLILFLVMIILFAFYYYEAMSWKDKAEAKEGEYLALNTEENQAIEKRVMNISRKLERFSLAFSSRKTPYKFFDFVRSFCHPNVSFSSASLLTEEGSVSLTGKTDTYKSLSEQILILKDVKEINNLSVSNVSLDREGNVSFNLSFTLSPEFFKP